LQILAKYAAQLIFVPCDARLKQMCDCGPEEEPPKFDHALQALQPQRLEHMSLRRQIVRRLLQGRGGFRVHFAQRIAFQDSNP